MTTQETTTATGPHLLTDVVYFLTPRAGGATVELWDMAADQVEGRFEVTGLNPGRAAAEEFGRRYGMFGR